ncbi:MAG: mobilization protein [Flavobacterium sp. 38-13]|uniref:plasmid mobilization protein n=1 Tax=Flavobacterium sp. 38-13 TaxID=1896168 RepID=UPI000959416F|nr:plasmid mobilization relaxosome protein MobC [Flavobacterium sp. 38-13]OJX54858.1 MAG: mobilization protein [Flavobacterium sp. 38-13]
MEEKKSNRIRIIKCRLTLQEYQLLEKKWKATACRKLSDYIRRHLFDKPIITIYRSKTEDEAIAELGRLRTELNHIGNNFNQAVKRLNTIENSDEFKDWFTAYELEKRTLSNKVDEIRLHMKKMAERWLL